MLYKLTTSESFFTDREASVLEALGFEFKNHNWLSYTKKIVAMDNRINITDISQLNSFILKYGDIAINCNSKGSEIEIIRVRK